MSEEQKRSIVEGAVREAIQSDDYKENIVEAKLEKSTNAA